MRFFTSEWWSGDGGSEVVKAYRTHFEAIRDALPPELVRLHERYTLHDGRVRSFGVADGMHGLSIVVDTYDNSNAYRRFRLTYSGVRKFEIMSTGSRDVADPGRWGDLGYHEVDRTDAGIEHRIIFCDDVELVIQFRAFTYAIEEGPS
jgi:hypothetical protein